MYAVTKDGRSMYLQDDVQLAAFLKSGWMEVAESTSYTSDSAEGEKFAILRAEADALGVKYHPNIGYDKLFEKVNAHKDGGAVGSA